MKEISRPSWAAPSIDPADPLLSDEDMHTTGLLRVLVADWRAGTLRLASSKGLDGRATWWPMPAVPAQHIQQWLPTIVPDVRALARCLTMPGKDEGGPTFPGGDSLHARIFEAVDALTRRWCARPAPRGRLADCRLCRHRIESSPHTEGLWADLTVAARYLCPEKKRERSFPWWHEPLDDDSAGSLRMDYRPYHDLVWVEARGGQYTGSCACGRWRADVPDEYRNLFSGFDGHANGPAPGAPFT